MGRRQLARTLLVLAAGAALLTTSPTEATPDTRRDERSRIRITIGEKVFHATLSDRGTARAFRALLPLTVDMADLNANEKHARLPRDLPRDAASPGTIHAGDLMLYGSDTLVLFYKTFPTAYRYTRIGKIDDTAGLAAALGARGVTIAFER